MKLRHPFWTRLLGFLVYTVAKIWLRTLDTRIATYDPTVEPHRRDCTQRNIYLFWHESIAVPLDLGGDCNLAMLTSRHGDADLLCRLALHLGYDTVRGSSQRGGDQAIRELLARSDQQHLAITPDGPQGPRRKLAVGCLFLASQTGLPLVFYAVGYDRPWRANSWDKFAVPRPFSRARIIISPRIWIPPNLDRAGIKYYRRRIEDMMNYLTAAAEGWAESKSRRVTEHVARPQPAPVGPTASETIAWLTPFGPHDAPAASAPSPSADEEQAARCAA